MIESTGPTENRSLGQALRDMKTKFADLEEEKELVLWSKKVANIEAEKAAGFSTSRNLEVEVEKEIIAHKFHRESKLALSVVDVYSG